MFVFGVGLMINSFVFSLLALAILGVMLDVVNTDSNSMISFVFDLVALLVVVTNIISLLGSPIARWM